MKIACIQLTSGPNISENIEKVEMFVESAARQGARFVALPENVFLMRDPADKNFALIPQDEHPAVQASLDIARQHQVWLLVGSVAVAGSGGKALNRSLLISPEGAITAQYDKIHLFDVQLADGEVYAESARFDSGSRAVVTPLEGIHLGMTICYDVRFPHLYRTLAKAGADVLAVPAAFTQVTGEAHWHILLRARAIECGAYVIAPAQTGTHAGGRRTFGHALIIDPWGQVLADAGEEEGVITADIDISAVQRIRHALPSLAHDRPFSMDS